MMVEKIQYKSEMDEIYLIMGMLRGYVVKGNDSTRYFG